MSHRFLFAIGFVMLAAIGSAYAATQVLDNVVSARAQQTCRGANFNGGKRNAGVFQSGCGYFTNTPMNISKYLSGTNGYILTGGIYKGSPIGTVVDKATYIASIKDRLNNGSTRDRNGAAFIIQTMRGSTNGADWNTTNRPTDAQIEDWESRINSPDITIKIETAGSELGNWLSTCRPYAAVDKCDEVAFIDYSSVKEGGSYSHYGIVSEPSVVFRKNGAVVYAQRAKCANTFGNLSTGLPEGKNYDLTPTITGTPNYSDGNNTGADKATLSPSINNTGTTASTSNVQWKIVNFILAPGVAVPTSGVSGSAPEAYYGNGAAAISSKQNQTFPKNVTSLTVDQQTIGDFPIGTRVCYALSVQPITQSNSAWRHSTPFCVTIAKSPKFQVHGGDIRVGSNFAGQSAGGASKIVTSQTVKNR